MCEDCNQLAAEFGEWARRMWLESRGNIVCVAVTDAKDGDGSALQISSPMELKEVCEVMRWAGDEDNLSGYRKTNEQGETLQ